MHYGNPDASGQQSGSAVWDGHHVMVLHLNDTAGSHVDATGNGNVGAEQPGPLSGDVAVVPDAIPGADGGGVYHDFWAGIAEAVVSQYPRLHTWGLKSGRNRQR